jgi:hypothetical protein
MEFIGVGIRGIWERLDTQRSWISPHLQYVSITQIYPPICASTSFVYLPLRRTVTWSSLKKSSPVFDNDQLLMVSISSTY